MKKGSIYENTLNIQGDATMKLSAQERTMICNALVRVLPTEIEPSPIIILIDRMVKGR